MPSGVVTGPGRAPMTVTGVRRRRSSLIGRDADLDDLLARLDEAPAVTLTGIGGVGKTRLAVETAARAAEEGARSVHVVELASTTDHSAVARVVADAIGLPIAGISAEQALVDGLRGEGPALLVLDNCEQVLDATAELVDVLLDGCPELCVLATSREALGIEGEQVWPVHPLAVGDGGDTGPAVALLHERAEAARPGTVAPDDEHLVELARRLDGVPLALELAAARLATLSVDELLDQLDADVLALGSTRRGAEGRHRSLAAMVEWSYQLLTDDEQDVLTALAVFSGTFSRSAVAEVVGPHAPAALDHLVEASLVVVEPGAEGTRYRLLEMIREFAQARSTDGGGLDALHRRHARWAIATAHHLQLGLRGPEEAEVASRWDEELPNIGAALRWACDAEELDVIVSLVIGLHDHVVSRAGREVHAWIDDAVGATADRPGAGDVLAVAAVAAIVRGDLSRAEALGTALVDVEVSDAPWFGVEGVLGTVNMFSGRMDDAAEHFGRLVEQAPHRNAWILAVVELSFCSAYTGRFAEAAELSGRALSAAEELGNPTLLAWSWFARGEALVGIDPERGFDAYRQARGHATAGRNAFVGNLATVGLASALARHGEPTEALEEFATAIGRWRSMGAWSFQSTTLRNLGELLVRVDRYEAALEIRSAVATLESSSGVGGLDAERDRYLVGVVRERLGDERFDQVTERGRQLGHDEVVEQAMDVVTTELRARRNVAELRAIVFTDLESSTRYLAEAGDSDGRAVMRIYDVRTDEALARHRGTRIKGTGDGVLATFPTATDALACVTELLGAIDRDVEAGALPLRVRVGVHAGESIADMGDVHGTAVNLTARVVDRADAGEVLVTDTVRQILLGSELTFEPVGEFDLKGIPEPVALHRLVRR